MRHPRAGESSLYHNLPVYLLSDIGRVPLVSLSLSNLLTSINVNLARIAKRVQRFAHILPALLPLCGRWVLALAVRTLAPLRKIVSRELEVFERCPKYFIYTLRDILECGHESWSPISLIDLLDAYTINPAISAKRHRCRPCASLLLTKKPVVSVALGKPAVAEVA